MWPIHLGRSIRLMTGRRKTSLNIAMDEAYDYNILCDIDPDDLHPEFQSCIGQVAKALESQLTPAQEEALDDFFVNTLTRMLWGSNMIENAGAGWDITSKLCQAIFRGDEVPDVVHTHEALKLDLMYHNKPHDTEAVLRSFREIIHHAKAARHIIREVFLSGKDLSEEIILETHHILTYEIDTEQGVSWTQYSGVYRKWPVCTGLHQYMDHEMVPGAMRKLIRSFKDDIKKAVQSGDIDPIALAAKYCHIFVNIHPFLDGNGRMCRLILNALLIKYGLGTIACIGETEKDRRAYLHIASAGSYLEGAREEDTEDLPEDMKPKYYKELASFALQHSLDMQREFRAMLGIEAIQGDESNDENAS